MTKETCKLPPKGWKCNGDEGHDGPCAAWPDAIGLRLVWSWRLKSLSILFGKHL
jgi:hypothetical protein